MAEYNGRFRSFNSTEVQSIANSWEVNSKLLGNEVMLDVECRMLQDLGPQKRVLVYSPDVIARPRSVPRLHIGDVAEHAVVVCKDAQS